MHIYPWLVIVAGLLSKCPGGDAQIQAIYICGSSGPILVNVDASFGTLLIRSPNYGSSGSYGNNLNCTLLLSSGDEPLVLSFYARDFNLELNYDTLCVNGVRFTGSWCAGGTSSFILPERSNSTVRFLTDSSVAYTGFDIQVTIRLADNQPVNQYVGIGSRPETVAQVPTTYYPGMPYSDRCLLPPQKADDYLLSTTTDDTTTVETTTEEPNDTTSSTSGYDSHYLCNSQDSTIEINSTSSPFFILSPNYGSGSYFNSQFCSLVLRSGAQPLVLNMDIKDFEVEPQIICSYDSLCVGGATFCGYDWLTGYRLQFILPEYSEYTINFRTDGSVVKRGFKIEVSQELATYQIVQQPWSGVVSGNATLAYTEEIYRPGYPYSDRCASTSFSTPQYTNEFIGTYTTTPRPYQDTCYSAAYVRELNEVLDQVIDGLNRAKTLLNQRK